MVARDKNLITNEKLILYEMNDKTPLCGKEDHLYRRTIICEDTIICIGNIILRNFYLYSVQNDGYKTIQA